MVMQSESIEFVNGKIVDGSTFTVEYGESTTVDYSDNSLDTVHATVTEVVTTLTNGKIYFDSILQTGEGNGNDIDSALLKGDGLAVNKLKFLSVAKTVNKIIDIRQTVITMVE